MRRLPKVKLGEGGTGVERTHGGRLFMFTICCTKLKVAVIMACEAVSWLPVSIRMCNPTGMTSQSQEYQRRRQSLERVGQLPRMGYTTMRTRKGAHLSFRGS